MEEQYISHPVPQPEDHYVINRISGEFIKLDAKEILEDKRIGNQQQQGIGLKESGDLWKNFFKTQHSRTTGYLHKKSKLPQTNGKTEDNSTDWEAWWLLSKPWLRFEVLFVVLLLLLSIGQFATAIWLFVLAYNEKIPEPYICTSSDCLNKVRWFNESMNKSFSPCDNFYGFVCGSYNDTYYGKFKKRIEWDINVARIEFGRPNLLTNILYMDKGHTTHSPHITFYQLCLDPKSRNKHDLNAFHKIYNKTFADIETSTNKSIEDYAAKVMGIIGDFGLFESELLGHPKILVRFNPSSLFIGSILNKTDDVDLKDVLKELMPNANLTKERLTKVIKGIDGIKANLRNIYKDSKNLGTKMCDESRNDRPFDFKKTIVNYFPEINNSQSSLYSDIMFIHETEIEGRFFYGITHCWNNTLVDEKDKKLTYAAFWMLRIFLSNFVALSDTQFKKMENTFGKTNIYNKAIRFKTLPPEVQCFRQMTRNLGYIPAHRFLQDLSKSLNKDIRIELIGEIDIFFTRQMKLVHRLWMDETLFPHIDSLRRKEGSLFLRGEDFHFITNIPTPQDLSSESKYDLESQLTNDHLENVLSGRRLIFHYGKRWWHRKNDLRHVLLWNPNTFNMEKGWRIVDPIDKINAIYTPMSFYMKPFYSDILSVRNGGMTIICLSEILSGVKKFTGSDNMKSKYPDLAKMTNARDGNRTNCILYNMSTTFADVFIKKKSLFLNVMTMKIAHFDSTDRKILENNYWKLNYEQRFWRLNRRLKGDLTVFSEEQLFFMTSVRNFCRSPKYQFLKEHIMNVNEVFKQMKEFALAWNCTDSSPMNPPNKCF